MNILFEILRWLLYCIFPRTASLIISYKTAGKLLT